MGFLAREWHVVEVRGVSAAGLKSYPAWHHPAVRFHGLDGDVGRGMTATWSSGRRGATLRIVGAESETLIEKRFEIFADMQVADLRFRLHEGEVTAAAPSTEWTARKAYHWLSRGLMPSRALRLADTNSVMMLQESVVHARPPAPPPIDFWPWVDKWIAEHVTTSQRTDDVPDIGGGA